MILPFSLSYIIEILSISNRPEKVFIQSIDLSTFLEHTVLPKNVKKH